MSIIEVLLLCMLTQSCYKVKALFNPVNSVCLISLTAGGYFFSEWTEAKPVLLESKSPNFVATVNWQEDKLFMALLQWDRTQVCHV